MAPSGQNVLRHILHWILGSHWVPYLCKALICYPPLSCVSPPVTRHGVAILQPPHHCLSCTCSQVPVLQSCFLTVTSVDGHDYWKICLFVPHFRSHCCTATAAIQRHPPPQSCRTRLTTHIIPPRLSICTPSWALKLSCRPPSIPIRQLHVQATRPECPSVG